MQGSLTASTFARLRSFIPFRLFPTYKFSFLILCSSAPLFLFSSSLISVATAQEATQVVNAGSVNRPTLRAGSQGDSVSELQGALKLLGYYTGEVDGNYNEQTAAAVSQFQKSAGLPADGIVAASTWQKLFPGLTTASASSGNSSNSATTRNETEGFSVPTQRTDNNRTTNSRSETKPVTRTTTTASSSEPKPTPRPTTTVSSSEPKPTPRPTTTVSSSEPKPAPRPTTTASSPEPKPVPRNRNTNSQRENTTTPQSTRRTQTTQESTRTSSAARRSQTSSSNQETRGNQTTRSNQATRTSQGTRTPQTTPSSRTTQNPGIQYTSAGMPILRLGMQGEEVQQLQRRLRRLGFFDGPVNGNFGTATESAVKAFQQKNGIEADGVVGGGTWVYLMPRRQQQR
jgi:peptidoglycan hydrolase-like protein with peptidoglycan-binding domain